MQKKGRGNQILLPESSTIITVNMGASKGILQSNVTNKTKTETKQGDQTATGRPSCYRRFITGIASYYYITRCNKLSHILRNRIYSKEKVTPEIRHTYPRNRVISPFWNRPLGFRVLDRHRVNSFFFCHTGTNQ